jgi:enoyl-CoA hydratase/carnithine racemase
MSESPDPVLCSFDPHSGIARITFNRPGAFNALDVAMAAAFEASTAWLLELEGLRCVVLQGGLRRTCPKLIRPSRGF